MEGTMKSEECDVPMVPIVIGPQLSTLHDDLKQPSTSQGHDIDSRNNNLRRPFLCRGPYVLQNSHQENLMKDTMKSVERVVPIVPIVIGPRLSTLHDDLKQPSTSQGHDIDSRTNNLRHPFLCRGPEILKEAAMKSVECDFPIVEPRILTLTDDLKQPSTSKGHEIDSRTNNLGHPVLRHDLYVLQNSHQENLKGTMKSVERVVPIVPVVIGPRLSTLHDDLKQPSTSQGHDIDSRTNNLHHPLLFSRDLEYDREVMSKMLSEKLKAMFAAHKENRSDMLDRMKVYKCQCGNHGDHRQLIQNVDRAVQRVNRVLKVIDVSSMKRSFEIHRLGKEDLPTEAAEYPDITSLRSLLRRAIFRFRSLDTGDQKSVIGNQQAINKLKQNGFGEEFKLFQSLHNARVSGQSDACSSELAKMLEKCHL